MLPIIIKSMHMLLHVAAWKHHEKKTLLGYTSYLRNKDSGLVGLFQTLYSGVPYSSASECYVASVVTLTPGQPLQPSSSWLLYTSKLHTSVDSYRKSVGCPGSVSLRL